MNRGSYRIWVDYLVKSLTLIGFSAKIVHSNNIYKEVTNESFVIFDKGLSASLINKVRSEIMLDVLFGSINPPAKDVLPVDFVIVGSREEASRLSKYTNIIYVPLVELPLHYLPFKVHADREVIKICYHGNALHLSSFLSSGLKLALEDLQSELKAAQRSLELTIISNVEKPWWIIGKPDINIKYLKYDWQTFPLQIVNYDIGIVPNCYNRSANRPISYLLKKVLNMELSDSDIILRMKSKSNFGRLLVFMQAGVPAVADLTPSHLELLGNLRYGFCASNRESWLKGLRQLIYASERNKVANEAKKYVSEKFDPVQWAQNFIEDITLIKKLTHEKDLKLSLNLN